MLLDSTPFDPQTALMAASAALALFLGLAHSLYTFGGSKLLPRDPSTIDSMKASSLVITKETTVWKAWLGFNASHSMALILFGLVYGYLAVGHPAVLYGSLYLQVVGLLMLGGFVVLGRLYWFSVPFAGASIALACYVASLFAAHA